MSPYNDEKCDTIQISLLYEKRNCSKESNYGFNRSIIDSVKVVVIHTTANHNDISHAIVISPIKNEMLRDTLREKFSYTNRYFFFEKYKLPIILGVCLSALSLKIYSKYTEDGKEGQEYFIMSWKRFLGISNEKKK
jgi:hypothetical protein